MKKMTEQKLLGMVLICGVPFAIGALIAGPLNDNSVWSHIPLLIAVGIAGVIGLNMIEDNAIRQYKKGE